MNLPKLIAVLALLADAATWLAIGKPVVAVCWAISAVLVALLVPAK